MNLLTIFESALKVQSTTNSNFKYIMYSLLFPYFQNYTYYLKGRVQCFSMQVVISVIDSSRC